jgi:hypothetical protein
LSLRDRRPNSEIEGVSGCREGAAHHRKGATLPEMTL